MKHLIKIGFLIIIIIIFLGSLGYKNANAYGECDQYGFMAMYDGLGSCKCMSGYVFGKDFMGKTACVSGDTICHDKYGYSSRYDSLSGSCECSYGYVLGKDSIGRTQCISENDACENQYGFNARSTFGGKCECGSGYAFGKDMFGKAQCISQDSMCKDQLGYGATYNSLYDKCECGYGDIIKNGKCTNADLFCSSEHGLYSSYNSSLKQCECDSGYTLDDSSQCVKKQNNVYFTVKELNTDNKQAIIKSDYDYSYYSITYNSGCFASSFRRYLNHQIVVNLGTDFYLDTWDKIVLQDDNETCDITHKEKVDSSFSLEIPEDPTIYIAPTMKINTTTNNIVAPVKPKPLVNKVYTQVKKETTTLDEVKVEQKEEVAPPINPKPVKKVPWYKKFWNWLF